jgi:leader peptidase (prepilin peptidase) / N-methyltransferase
VRAAGIAIASLFGLLFGSFANVVIYRVPKRESIVRPPSRCGSCGTEIRPRDNIPVLSWILLRARCRTCGTRISVRYPAVEALTAALFGLAAATLDATDLIAYLPLVFALIVLSFIDIDHKLLPNRIVIPTLVAELVLFAVSAAVGPGARAYITALAGMGGAFLFFFLLALISPGGMGMGDVKLSAVLGLALGYFGWARTVLGLFLGFFIGSIGGIALIMARRGGRKTQIPFGPYMALGALIAVFFGGPLVDLWLQR